MQGPALQVFLQMMNTPYGSTEPFIPMYSPAIFAEDLMQYVVSENIEYDNSTYKEFFVNDALFFISQIYENEKIPIEIRKEFYSELKKRGLIRKLTSFLYNPYIASDAIQLFEKFNKTKLAIHIDEAFQIVYKNFNPVFAHKAILAMKKLKYIKYKKNLEQLIFEDTLTAKITLLLYHHEKNYESSMAIKLLKDKEIEDLLLPHRKKRKYNKEYEMFLRIDDFLGTAFDKVYYENPEFSPKTFIYEMRKYYWNFEKNYKVDSYEEYIKNFLKSSIAQRE